MSNENEYSIEVHDGMTFYEFASELPVPARDVLWAGASEFAAYGGAGTTHRSALYRK